MAGRLFIYCVEMDQKYGYTNNMKTIAITIDDTTLKLLDELTDGTSRRSRSALVRTALREFAERERRREVEAKESAILRKHRKRLARQARALISEQARS